MHGKGTLYYANGAVAYDGNWYMDAFHGKGKMSNDHPRQLNEEFDYKNLKGYNIDECWEEYEGDFFYQQRHGKGKLKLSNGELYLGDFVDDQIHGQGKFYRLNGQVIHGRWEEGIFV